MGTMEFSIGTNAGKDGGAPAIAAKGRSKMEVNDCFTVLLSL